MRGPSAVHSYGLARDLHPTSVTHLSVVNVRVEYRQAHFLGQPRKLEKSPRRRTSRQTHRRRPRIPICAMFGTYHRPAGGTAGLARRRRSSERRIRDCGRRGCASSVGEILAFSRGLVAKKVRMRASRLGMRPREHCAARRSTSASTSMMRPGAGGHLRVAADAGTSARRTRTRSPARGISPAASGIRADAAARPTSGRPPGLALYNPEYHRTA